MLVADSHQIATYTHNQYLAESWNTIWFAQGWQTQIDRHDWSVFSGEENPSFDLPEYANAEITLEDYLMTENLGSTLTDLVSQMTDQGKEGWDQRLEVTLINQFLRSGFELVE